MRVMFDVPHEMLLRNGFVMRRVWRCVNGLKKLRRHEDTEDGQLGDHIFIVSWCLGTLVFLDALAKVSPFLIIWVVGL